MSHEHDHSSYKVAEKVARRIQNKKLAAVVVFSLRAWRLALCPGDDIAMSIATFTSQSVHHEEQLAVLPQTPKLTDSRTSISQGLKKRKIAA